MRQKKVCASAVAAAIVAGVGQADTLEAQLRLSVGSGELLVIPLVGEPLAQGLHRFEGEADMTGGMFSWDLVAQPDPGARTSAISGTVNVLNDTSASQHYTFRFSFKPCPWVETETLLGGLTTLTFLTNEEGGALSLVEPGTSLFALRNDDEVSGQIFYAPFLLTISGPGIAQTTEEFGSPFPSQIAGPIEESFALQHQFEMTAGDSVTFQSIVFLEADPDDLNVCFDADLNNDGTVDIADMLVVISNWGICGIGGDCSGDVDGDGDVGQSDLLIIISEWGGA